MIQTGKTPMMFVFLLRNSNEANMCKFMATTHFNSIRKALIYTHLRGYHSYRYLSYHLLEQLKETNSNE